MEPLLFLAQRLPYPPDKGDKIRSWHILKHLARSHRIFLGTFIDDAEDARHLPAVRDICADVACFPISPLPRRLRALLRLRPGRPLTLDYFHDARLASWVEATIAREAIRRAFVFSSSMAPYAMPFAGRRILDLVDLDSAKWEEYARRRRWPVSRVYAREAHTLAAFERRAAGAFDCTLFVSEAEAADFRSAAPRAGRIGAMANGVDLAYFAPGRDYPNPYPAGVLPLVFTGAMDYWPNIDAVEWFAGDILPRLRNSGSAVHFTIVGSRPDRAVRRLARLPGVSVTGRVPDTRPYLAHAFAAVAPLRVARGVQNKVLEALAMAVPVVASPAACCGIAAAPGAELLVAAAPEQWVERLAALSPAARRQLGEAGRRFVERHHRWERNLRLLDGLLPPQAAEGAA